MAIGLGTGLLLGGAALMGLDIGFRTKNALEAPSQEQARRRAEALQLQGAVSENLLLGDPELDAQLDLAQGLGLDRDLGQTPLGVERELMRMVQAESGQLSEIAKRSFPTPAEVAAAAGISLR